MKDLTDFVAIGKEVGFTGDELLNFAKDEFKKYEDKCEKEEERRLKEEEKEQKRLEDEEKRRLKIEADEEKRKKDDFDREMRLLDRKERISTNEATTAAGHDTTSSRNPHVPSLSLQVSMRNWMT